MLIGSNHLKETKLTDLVLAVQFLNLFKFYGIKFLSED